MGPSLLLGCVPGVWVGFGELGAAVANPLTFAVFRTAKVYHAAIVQTITLIWQTITFAV